MEKREKQGFSIAFLYFVPVHKEFGKTYEMILCLSEINQIVLSLESETGGD